MSLRKLSNFKKNNPEYYVARGEAYFHIREQTPKLLLDSLINLSQENYAAAEKDFEKAIQLDENCKRAYSMRAILYSVKYLLEDDLSEGYFQAGLSFYYAEKYRNAILFF